MERVADEAGYSLLLSNSDYSEEKMLRAIRMMQGKMVSGILVVHLEVHDPRSPLLQELRRSGIPYVLFGERYENVDADCVEADDYTGALKAAEYLFDLGHRRVGFAYASPKSVYGTRRLNGVREAYRRRGIPFPEEYVFEKAGNMPDGEKIVHKLMTMQEPPTAVIAFNDVVAMGIIKGLHAMGKRVPEDLSVVGFDNLELMPYPMTTVDIPYDRMGEEAARLLLERMDEPEKPVQRVLLPTELIVRETTAPR